MTRLAEGKPIGTSKKFVAALDDERAMDLAGKFVSEGFVLAVGLPPPAFYSAIFHKSPFKRVKVLTMRPFCMSPPDKDATMRDYGPQFFIAMTELAICIAVICLNLYSKPGFNLPSANSESGRAHPFRAQSYAHSSKMM